MAVNPVSLVESLRPWKNMGLHYLLFRSAEEAADLAPSGNAPAGAGLTGRSVRSAQKAGEAVEVRAGAPQRGPSYHAGPSLYGRQSAPDEQGMADAQFRQQNARASSASSAPSTAPGHSAGVGHMTADGHSAARARQTAPGKPTAGQSVAGGRAAATGHSDAVAFAAPPADQRHKTAPAWQGPDISTLWPENWQKLWQRTLPAPVLWTYPELGIDLMGQGSAERSNLLKRLMAALAFPKGSSVFWPCRLPDDPAFPVDRKPADSPFLQGLSMLQPKVIILGGQESLAWIELSPPLSLPFTQSLYTGKLTLLLPDIDTMARDEKSFARCVAFLRSALSGLPFLESS